MKYYVMWDIGTHIESDHDTGWREFTTEIEAKAYISSFTRRHGITVILIKGEELEVKMSKPIDAYDQFMMSGG